MSSRHPLTARGAPEPANHSPRRAQKSSYRDRQAADDPGAQRARRTCDRHFAAGVFVEQRLQPNEIGKAIAQLRKISLDPTGSRHRPRAAQGAIGFSLLDPRQQQKCRLLPTVGIIGKEPTRRRSGMQPPGAFAGESRRIDPIQPFQCWAARLGDVAGQSAIKQTQQQIGGFRLVDEELVRSCERQPLTAWRDAIGIARIPRSPW